MAAATYIVCLMPKVLIRNKAHKTVPRNAPRVLIEYNIPVSNPRFLNYPENPLTRIGKVAPIRVVGIINAMNAKQNLIKGYNAGFIAAECISPT